MRARACTPRHRQRTPRTHTCSLTAHTCSLLCVHVYLSSYMNRQTPVHAYAESLCMWHACVCVWVCVCVSLCIPVPGLPARHRARQCRAPAKTTCAGPVAAAGNNDNGAQSARLARGGRRAGRAGRWAQRARRADYHRSRPGQCGCVRHRVAGSAARTRAGERTEGPSRECSAAPDGSRAILLPPEVPAADHACAEGGSRAVSTRAALRARGARSSVPGGVPCRCGPRRRRASRAPAAA